MVFNIMFENHICNIATTDIVGKQFQKKQIDKPKQRRCYSVGMEAGGWEIVKKYVEMGLGISILTNVCLTGNEKLTAIPLDKYFPPRNYGLIVRKGKFFTPQARRFIEMFDPDFFGS